MRGERWTLFIGFVDAVQDLLLLPDDLRRVGGVDEIEGPFTFVHLQPQLAIELLLCQRSNIIHALLEFALCAFATAFRRLRVENGIAYCLSLLDHVFELMFDTPAQVSFPLFIGLNDATVCMNWWRMWWWCWRWGR